MSTDGPPSPTPTAGSREESASASAAVRPPIPVHYLHPPAAPALDRLCARLPAGISLTAGGAMPGGHCEILVCGQPSAEDLRASGARSLVVPHAGLYPGTRDVLLRFPGVAVHCLRFSAVVTAEMAITLLLAASKGLLPADRALRRGEWSRHEPLVALEGRRALVLGHGDVGARVTRLVAALGMRVSVVRRRPHIGGAAGPATHHTAAELPMLLPATDALIACLPSTPETRAMIGRREIELMPRHAVLINVGRAEVVEEEAFYEALRDRRLRAAGLDVWYQEPERSNGFSDVEPSRYPFRELANVVLSPHRAWRVADAEARRVDALADTLAHAVRGEPMPNRVDVEAGY